MTTLEFDRLVRQYQGLVYTVCHQLVPDVGEAQDLTQETFLAAWRSIDRCPPGFEKQWLARIASNKAESDPEQQVLETLGEEDLTRRILALREPYTTPCRLMLLEQHTAVEAARLCGRPQKTVEAQVYRAKKMLAAQLRASGAEAPQKPERRNQNG